MTDTFSPVKVEKYDGIEADSEQEEDDPAQSNVQNQRRINKITEELRELMKQNSSTIRISIKGNTLISRQVDRSVQTQNLARRKLPNDCFINFYYFFMENDCKDTAS